MKGSSTEIAIEQNLGLIWEISDLFTAHICSASLTANAIFKDCSFWRDGFENRFYLNYSMTTPKNVTKILQYIN